MQHVVLLLLAAVLSSCESSTKDYCVIGAGPAGIQLGYYLHHANADYVVFERSNTSGNFFVTYPRHGQLISINKRNTGKTNDDFNMRHDWNSLLSDDINMRFTRYTKKFFPKKELLVDYLNDFTNKYKLHVQFNTTIEKITASNVKDEAMQLVDSNKNLYKCRPGFSVGVYAMIEELRKEQLYVKRPMEDIVTGMPAIPTKRSTIDRELRLKNIYHDRKNRMSPLTFLHRIAHNIKI